METNTHSQEATFDWKLFFILWGMVIGGVIAAIPFSLTLQAEKLKTAQLPLPLELLIPIQIVANALIFGLFTGLGLYLAPRVGLGLPFLSSLIRKEKPAQPFRPVALLALVIGVLAAGIIAALDLRVFSLEAHFKALAISVPEPPTPPPWQGFLAAFYGGIAEEVLLRLFLLTLLGWLGCLIARCQAATLPSPIFWIANVLTAILFGLGHLPATAAMGIPLDTFVIIRAIVLNGIAGLAFGWLYWKHGLESAMVAHFSADIVLHVFLAF